VIRRHGWLLGLVSLSLLLTAAAPRVAEAATVAPRGDATTLDVANWNVEWFGDTTQAPTNDALQQSNVRDTILGVDFDVWALEEVVGATSFANLIAGLPGYTGILSNDSRVTSGSAYYSSTEQKVALLWKTSVASLVSAKLILTANDNDFGGRPPMEVRLSVTLNGTTEDRIFIVLHAKAMADSASWQRRVNASNALKAYLDATYPTQKVIVLGDWNDDLDQSILAGYASPYENYLVDSAHYDFPTWYFSQNGISTTCGYPDAIDHQLNTNEQFADLVPGSVESYHLDTQITGYCTNTTDHYPTLVRYTFGTGTPPPAASVTVTRPKGGESWTAGTVQNVAWSSVGVTNVKLQYTLDGGATWADIVASTPASAGSYAWTLPAQASTTVRVRVSEAASGTPSDTSDAAFTIVAGGTPAKVILNEICANEPGSDTAGEFIELVNVGGTSIDISGWKLWDSTAARHTFAPGTILAAGKAVVVFGAARGHPGWHALGDRLVHGEPPPRELVRHRVDPQHGRHDDGLLHVRLEPLGHRRRLDEPQSRHHRRRSDGAPHGHLVAQGEPGQAGERRRILTRAPARPGADSQPTRVASARPGSMSARCCVSAIVRETLPRNCIPWAAEPGGRGGCCASVGRWGRGRCTRMQLTR
jgi:hypothetical protein